jgi:acetyltransferase EpsM
VVADAAMSLGYNLIGCFDDGAAPVVTSKFRLARRGSVSAAREFLESNQRVQWILTIGDLAVRQRVLTELRPYQERAAKIVHKAAVIGGNTHIARGTFVGALAVVQTFAVVYGHSIINTGAIVEHECELGESVHVAPGAILTGNVKVGRYAMIGAGARVLPGLKIGISTVVGAGAVVTKDFGDNLKVAGVPARIVPGVQ